MIKIWLKRTGVFLLLLLVVAQFFKPETNNGDISSVTPFFKATKTPDSVKVILKNACLDCHSNYTRYPWYSKITPVNYWMTNHIKHGKEKLNISKWNDYSNKKKDHKLEEIIEEVEHGHMPIASYTWTHANANLTQQEIKALITWANNARTAFLFSKQP